MTPADAERLAALLRSRDLELPEFHAMQLQIADCLTEREVLLKRAAVLAGICAERATCLPNTWGNWLRDYEGGGG
jgi:hypothetical protein